MKFLAFIIAIAVVGLTLTAAATAGAWRAGTPYMVEESEMADLLEQTYDWAYCTGIPRFGQMGEFPYERFIVFECSTKLDGTYCSDYRVRSVKDRQRGYFRLRWVKGYGDCF